MTTLRVNNNLRIIGKLHIPYDNVITTILVGTSPNGYILKSTNNGDSFSIDSTSIYGNPLCFSKLTNGDILYSTDAGYIVNYTKNTIKQVSQYAIKIIRKIGNTLLCGDINGDCYLLVSSTIEGDWNNIGSIGYQINSIEEFVVFTAEGIFTFNSELVQVGNFLCSYFDEGSGFIYTGTHNGRIYRNTTSNNFSSWVQVYDFGVSAVDVPINLIFVGHNNRVFINTLSWSYTNEEGGGSSSGNRLYYFHDFNFNSIYDSQIKLDQDINCIAKFGTSGLIIGSMHGYIKYSLSNGQSDSNPFATTWIESDNNPQQGESSINCIISL